MSQQIDTEISFKTVCFSDLKREIGSSTLIDTAFEPDVLPERMFGDVIRLQQVLINLVKNALKFTSKGRIHILMAHDAQRHKLLVKVVDTGYGICKED